MPSHLSVGEFIANLKPIRRPVVLGFERSVDEAEEEEARGADGSELGNDR